MYPPIEPRRLPPMYPPPYLIVLAELRLHCSPARPVLAAGFTSKAVTLLLKIRYTSSMFTPITPTATCPLMCCSTCFLGVCSPVI